MIHLMSLLYAQGDDATRWLIFIRTRAGSATRSPSCTSLQAADLRALVAIMSAEGNGIP